MKTNNSARVGMLMEYSVRVKILMEYLHTINPWCCSLGKVEQMLEDLGESLRFAQFVGLVVSKAPTIKGKSRWGNVGSMGEGQEVSYAIQGEEFCDWFNNLHPIEINEPKEGEKGFRIEEVSPECIIDEVVFFNGYGWLSDLERKNLRETNPNFVSKII